MTNLANRLLRSATEHADGVATRLADRTLSYAELDDASARVAALLTSRGVEPGDRVGIMLPNVIEFPVIYYGILRAGAVAVPMNPLLKSREVGFYLSDSGATIAFVWTGVIDEAGDGFANGGADAIGVDGEFVAGLAAHVPTVGAVEREATDTAVILYTSGTTGTPKGAELTHGNLGRNIDVSIGLFAATPADVIFGGLPLFHSFGQTCGLNTAISCGATLTLLPRFDPAAALDIIQRDGVTILEAVPTMYTALLQLPDRTKYDTSSLRVCVSGGAALPVEILHGFEAAFACVILEGYGLSETSPVATFNQVDVGRKPGSIGTPIEGVEIRLLDTDGADVADGEVGEIAIRGHNVMKSYWNRPEATAEAIQDGWFRSGDLARRDEDGFYFVVDRKKDMIIRGGFNVYPREIEEVLYEHPAVAEVAVLGVPHPTHGEEVAAAVVLKPGSPVTPDELRDYAKERVAAYKYPRHVWLVDALPKGATGKIQKRDIRSPVTVTTVMR
jgi:long-chain acyl-CoA synthetase